ncbi:hypothetical protein J3R74_000076 [Puniceicoccus vermicola]
MRALDWNPSTLDIVEGPPPLLAGEEFGAKLDCTLNHVGTSVSCWEERSVKTMFLERGL